MAAAVLGGGARPAHESKPGERERQRGAWPRCHAAAAMRCVRRVAARRRLARRAQRSRRGAPASRAQQPYALQLRLAGADTLSRCGCVLQGRMATAAGAAPAGGAAAGGALSARELKELEKRRQKRVQRKEGKKARAFPRRRRTRCRCRLAQSACAPAQPPALCARAHAPF